MTFSHVPMFLRTVCGIVLVCVLSACATLETAVTPPPAVAEEQKQETSKPVQKPIIFASFFPMAEFTRRVVGDTAEVVQLVPMGVEAHDWEPTPQQLVRLGQARALVYNGSGMEGWIEQVRSAIDNPNVLMIEASKGLATLNATDDPTHDHGHDHAHEKKQADKQTPDPHVWLSLPKAIAQVRAITNALAAEFPDLAQTMQANAAQYTQELAALYETYRKQLAPYAKRAFVTQHAAFAYLAESFDLVQYPISGISPQQEPSPARMAQLIKVMNKERVRTVYFETLASSKTAEAIAKETGALTAVLHPLEALTEEEQQANDTYIAIMERNINALLKGFVP